MNKNFDINLNKAINKLENYYIDNNTFFKLYPYTTENISGYIDNFNLKDKSLLTVGSSGDQVINAILKGCKNITLIDINNYAKYYYYLKISSILCLDIEEFMNFICYVDYPEYCQDNKNALNKDTFNKIKTTLRLLDYESYIFWDELIQTYKSPIVRSSLFFRDEYRHNVLKEINIYLSSKNMYNKTKEKIKKVKPKFINADLFNISLDKKYDNIWLSNISSYLTIEEFKYLLHKISPFLNDDGMLLAAYLYDATEKTIYQTNWQPIYNLNRIFKELNDYNLDIISFDGLTGMKYNLNNRKDSILVYKK